MYGVVDSQDGSHKTTPESKTKTKTNFLTDSDHFDIIMTELSQFLLGTMPTSLHIVSTLYTFHVSV